MSDEIKNLIEKINQEGIRAAEKKAAQIESEAREKAAEILKNAQLDADKLIKGAEEQARLMDEKEKALLAQAGRDLLLTLRKEINSMLERIVAQEIRQALTPQYLGGIISELIQKAHAQDSGDIIVSLKKEDLDALSADFLAKLKEETRRQIVLKPSGEISGGFTISFDSGKSQYDFTDKALVEYIGGYLKPKLAQILNSSAK